MQQESCVRSKTEKSCLDPNRVAESESQAVGDFWMEPESDF